MDITFLRRAIVLSQEAYETGNDPFACLLVGPNGNILMEQVNAALDGMPQGRRDPVGHDVLSLLRRAVRAYDAPFLRRCTLYTSIEPCIMCLSAALWAEVGTIKFAVEESRLVAMYPGGSEIRSKEFAARQSGPFTCKGPFPEVAEEAFSILQTWVTGLNGSGQRKN